MSAITADQETGENKAIAASYRAAKRYDDSMDQAADEMLADVDSMADWLYAACMGVNHVDVDSVVSSLKRFHTLEDFDAATLFALVVSPNAATRASAGWALRERYLSERAATLHATANEIAVFCEGEGEGEGETS